MVEEFQNCTLDDLPVELDRLLLVYTSEEYESFDFHALFSKGMELFQIQSGISEEEFEKRFNKHLLRVASLQHFFAEHGLFTEIDDEEISREYLLKFNRIFEILYYWNHLFSALTKQKKRTNRKFDGEINTSLGLSRFEPIDIDSYTPFQSLIQYLMFRLREKGYRRLLSTTGGKSYCMKRVYTKNGYDTHAWEPEMEIKTFIMLETQRDVNRQQFLNLTKNPGNKRSAEEFLKDLVDDIYFPDVITDRKIFSFENGIYETCIYDEIQEKYIDRWYPHDDETFEFNSKQVLTERSACNYFQQDLTYHDPTIPWYDIETPYLQSILDYQNFEVDVCKMMYTFIGRLLYELGSMDNWQVMPFLLGKAKTGKSTVLNEVVARFFPPEKLGNLSNNVESKFGLSALVDKYVFIGPEIKANLGLEQSEFQTIISGETTSVNVKFQTSSSAKWKVPGIIAGNQPPGYQDNQGSIARRLIIFDFINKVKNGDTKLGQKLEKEIPNILLKCNRAYLDAVNSYGQQDIWNVVPSYFEKTRNMMAEQINSLVDFLNSELVVYDPMVHVMKKRFTLEFKQYCKTNQLPMPPFKKQFYEGPFEDKDLQIYRGVRWCQLEQRNKKGEWVIGIQLSSDIVTPENNTNDIDNFN